MSIRAHYLYKITTLIMLNCWLSHLSLTRSRALLIRSYFCLENEKIVTRSFEIKGINTTLIWHCKKLLFNFLYKLVVHFKIKFFYVFVMMDSWITECNLLNVVPVGDDNRKINPFNSKIEQIGVINNPTNCLIKFICHFSWLRRIFNLTVHPEQQFYCI